MGVGRGPGGGVGFGISRGGDRDSVLLFSRRPLPRIDPAGYIRNQNIEAAAWRSEEDIQNDDSDDESTTPTKTQTE